MRDFELSENLIKILKKLCKKDNKLYQVLLKKIEQIINDSDVEHYKNLKHNMKDSKRVHLGHFVLVFRYNRTNDSILFDDFDHHDNIYKKKFG